MKNVTTYQLKTAKEPQATSVTAKELKLPSAPRMLCCGYCFVAVSGVCSARRKSFELTKSVVVVCILSLATCCFFLSPFLRNLVIMGSSAKCLSSCESTAQNSNFHSTSTGWLFTCLENRSQEHVREKQPERRHQKRSNFNSSAGVENGTPARKGPSQLLMRYENTDTTAQCV